MRISTKLKIFPGVILAMTLASAIIIGLSFRGLLSDTTQSNAIISIIVKIYKLNGLTHEYLVLQEERPKMQWLVQNNELADLLKQVSTKYPQNDHYFLLLSTAQKKVTKLFKQIVAENSQFNRDRTNLKKHSQLAQHLESQIQLIMHTMIIDAVHLNKHSQTAQIAKHKVTGWVLFTVIVVSGVLLALLSYIVSRSVLLPLQKLSVAAEKVGAGSFDYQISSRNMDELGDLSNNFDTMVRRLKESAIAHNKFQDEARHLDRVALLGTMTAGIAHEINQPLAAILSNAQAAIRFLNFKQPDLKNVEEALQDIVADDKRAAEVIRRLRALLSKKESQLDVICINDNVREIVTLTKSESVIKNAVITAKLDKDLPKIHCDKVQIQQVILNLLLNALDSLKDISTNERNILVSTKMYNTKEICVCVSDSGKGIEAHILPDLFESFFTTKEQGLGMGLPISKSIIEQHSGRMWAENNKSGGAAFTFTLPVEKSLHLA